MQKIDFVNLQAPALSATVLNNLQDYIEQAIEKALKDSHPVGSLYFSKESTDPAELFGGTWERIKDTFILACGDEFPSGSVGGEKNHTLTINEMPSHFHEIKQNANGVPARVVSLYNTNHNTSITNEFAIKDSAIELIEGGTDELFSSYKGGQQPHNNMPPYMSVYVWKRIS